jgi:hypothetical protein
MGITMKIIKARPLIENKILILRGLKIVIDIDLASFYGVTIKRFREQVRRNKDRFPIDFMIQLTREEQSKVVTICDHLPSLINFT